MNVYHPHLIMEHHLHHNRIVRLSILIGIIQMIRLHIASPSNCCLLSVLRSKVLEFHMWLQATARLHSLNLRQANDLTFKIGSINVYENVCVCVSFDVYRRVRAIVWLLRIRYKCFIYIYIYRMKDRKFRPFELNEGKKCMNWSDV